MDAQKLICANCAANIAGQLYVVCMTCKQVYDMSCANIPEDTYHRRKKESWVCDHCKAGEQRPIAVSSRSSPDLQSVPQPPRAENVTNTEDINDINVIRQIIYFETTDLLQGHLVAMISSAVNSQIAPIVENCMGNISERIANIEIQIISLETGRRHIAYPQNANPVNTYISTRECPTPLCIPPIYENEIYESGKSFRETEVPRDDGFGGIRIIIRDELKSIMDERVSNMISLAVVDQIAPIMQICIGNLEGRIIALEDKLQLLETSRRRTQTRKKTRPKVEIENSQTGNRANPGMSKPQTGTNSKVDGPGTSHSPSAGHNQETQNLGLKAPHDATTTNTDNSLCIDEVRTLVRDELSNVLNERLTKTISKAIAEQIAPAIESSFGKLSGRVATIEERINRLESAPGINFDSKNIPGELKIAPQASSEKRDGLDHVKSVDNTNIPGQLKIAPQANSDKRDGLDHVKSIDNMNIPGQLKIVPQANSAKLDGLDHVKSTSQINIDKEKFKNSTAVSGDKDNGPGKLKSSYQINIDKTYDPSKLKSTTQVSVDKMNSPDQLKASQVSIDEDVDSIESGVDEKSSSSALENSPEENVSQENNSSGEFNIQYYGIIFVFNLCRINNQFL